jgi:hypothetical protein
MNDSTMTADIVEASWRGRKTTEDILQDTEEDPKIYHYWTEGKENNQSSSSLSLSPSPSSSPSSSSSFLGTNGLSRSEQKAATIAACCLKDYERGHSPTLPRNFDGITRQQLILYQVKYSYSWRIFGISLSTFFLFVPSFNGKLLTLFLHAYSILMFSIDLYIKDQFFDDQKYHVIEGKRSRVLFHAMKLLLILLSLQACLQYLFTNSPTVHAFTLAVSVFKPIIFFYESRRARDALEALIRISKKLLHVILIEFFLILIFAAIACRLYYDNESFQSLPQAWVSLFACEFAICSATS